MSILADMQRVIKPLGIPIETGVFTDKAPDKYIVVVPLTDKRHVFLYTPKAAIPRKRTHLFVP